MAFRQAGSSTHAGAGGLYLAQFHQAGANRCGGCAMYTFPNGPYTLAPTAGTVFTIVDVATLNLSGFNPASFWYVFFSITFTSPANWDAAHKRPGAMYLGGATLPIGTSQPPSAITGPINVQLQDPGPANATTTVTFGPFNTFTNETPGPAVPLKLAIGTGLSHTTTIVSASFKVCDHPF